MAIKKIPCGGFYVNDDAVEMIDGKPVLKTGGGGWPADLPKPSVGGYGYTASGEQTVIVDESVITIKGEVVSYATGVFVEPALLEVGSNYTVIFNDSEYVVTGEDFGGGASVGAKVTADGADFSVYPFAVIYSEGAPVILVTQSAGTYTVTISESSETVHKIDEKYLPASGGAMVVTVESDDDGVLHANKTFAEIKSAIKSGLDVNCVYEQCIARLSGYELW